jgi:hypothetical protein
MIYQLTEAQAPKQKFEFGGEMNDETKVVELVGTELETKLLGN